MAAILVVDDEIGIRELLSEILGDEGHEVGQAENAAQARAARQKERPDLVLLDIWMPDTDGIALLREWSEAGLLDMPVIMMSGHATVEMASQATRLGAIGFLEKPIALQKLLTAVQNGLQGKRALPASAKPYLQAAGAHPGPGSIPHKPHGADDPPHAPASENHALQAARDPMPADGLIEQASAALPGTNPLSSPPSASYPEVWSQARTSGLASPWGLSSAMDRDSTSPSARLALLSFDQPLREARDAFERLYFEHHLAREGGSMTRVAERTGLERTHLYRKLKQLGVELGRSPRREL
jgi:DNA-binding NtrC family response regulator